MPWWRRRRSQVGAGGKRDPIPVAKLDEAKPDPVRGYTFAPPPFGGPVPGGRVSPPPQRPKMAPPPRRPMPVQSWIPADWHRDAADDDAIVADLTDTLIRQAGDEWHAPGSTGDPYFRCSELLAVELSRYDPGIADRVEADAYHAMLDAAHDLADRLRDDEDEPGW